MCSPTHRARLCRSCARRRFLPSTERQIYPTPTCLAGEPLAGPPEWWVYTLAGFVADGFETLVFWPANPTPDQVDVWQAKSYRGSEPA